MAKFTNKFVREGLANTCQVKNWKELAVKGDDAATFNNVAMNVLAVGTCLDTAYIFEAKFPEGIGELMDGYTTAWEGLRAELAKKFPKQYKPFAKMFDIIPASGEEASDEDDADDEEDEDADGGYGDMSLKELKALCKEREIAFGKKDDEDALIEKLEAWDAEQGDEDEDEDEESDEDDEDEEDEEEAESEYADKSVKELKALCKERGIEFGKKATAEDLIALLEEDDAADEEGEDEDEEEDEEDEESEEVDYSEKTLEELKELCGERGIKFGKKAKAKDLIALLEAADEESDEEEEEEDEDLDEILDEEFEEEELDDEEEEEEEKPKASKKGKGKK